MGIDVALVKGLSTGNSYDFTQGVKQELNNRIVGALADRKQVVGAKLGLRGKPNNDG